MRAWPRLEFGIPIPQVFMEGPAETETIRSTLERAEALGFHSAWTQDQVAGAAPVLEAITLMSYAAAVTRHLKIGVSVIVFPVRNAVVLAKQVATLDQLSAGRVILGLGLGPVQAEHYYRWFGTRGSDAVRRFNEGVDVMKSLWTRPATDFDGDFYQLRGTALEPKPVQRPHPPLWFGGQHPAALRRAARHADGYMGAGPTSNGEFAAHLAVLRRALAEAGRDPAGFPVSKRVYLAVDDDERRAKGRLDAFFAARYPWQVARNPDYVADTCVWGSPRRIAEGLAEVVRLGAGLLVLNPLWDFVGQLEALASEVVPMLRREFPGGPPVVA